jgi:hypothetical protein
MGVSSYRTDLVIGYSTPFDCLVVNGEERDTFPIRCSGGSKICFRDYRTFGLIVPIPPWPAGSDTPVVLWRSGGFLLVSMYNYEGTPRDFSRHAINGWRTGFALELVTSRETDWDSFVRGAEAAGVEERTHDGSLRTVRYHSGDDVMEFAYDPFRESIVSRLWNGEPDSEDHLSVQAGSETTGLFCPRSIFGAEVMP